MKHKPNSKFMQKQLQNIMQIKGGHIGKLKGSLINFALTMANKEYILL